MSRYTKRHYEDCVRLLADTHARYIKLVPTWDADKARRLTLESVVAWADLYAADNELFDKNRFIRACVKQTGMNPVNLSYEYLPSAVSLAIMVEHPESECYCNENQQSTCICACHESSTDD